MECHAGAGDTGIGSDYDEEIIISSSATVATAKDDVGPKNAMGDERRIENSSVESEVEGIVVVAEVDSTDSSLSGEEIFL